MKALMIVVVIGVLSAAPGVFAAEKGKKDDPAHVSQDVADHLAMAEAHLNAARCLKEGKPEKECQAQLAKDCKGLGIGKYCGMKHKH